MTPFLLHSFMRCEHHIITTLCTPGKCNFIYERRVEPRKKQGQARVIIEMIYNASSSSYSSRDRDLFDLVASFMERDERCGLLPPPDFDTVKPRRTESDTKSLSNNDVGFFDSDSPSDNDVDDDIEKGRQKIRSMVEDSLKIIGGGDDDDASSDNQWTKLSFKRQLVALLRNRGLDAGVCKSKWEKTCKIPVGGDYEYIDVNLSDGSRFIVEVGLAGNFQIARPTARYSALVDLFIPRVFVGTPEELKQLVRVMCNGIEESMNTTRLLLPPWRRNTYMQAKWFASYQRSTNILLLNKPPPPPPACGCQLGLPEICYECCHDFATNNNIIQLKRSGGGYLTQAFSTLS